MRWPSTLEQTTSPIISDIQGGANNHSKTRGLAKWRQRATSTNLCFQFGASNNASILRYASWAKQRARHCWVSKLWQTWTLSGIQFVATLMCPFGISMPSELGGHLGLQTLIGLSEEGKPIASISWETESEWKDTLCLWVSTKGQTIVGPSL